MSSIKPMMKKVLTRIAKRVHRHDLFEQPYERTTQTPLRPPSPVEVTKSNIQEVEKVQPAKIVSGEVRPSSAEELLNWLNSIKRPVVINHWATWCEPCQDEMALLAQLQTQLGEVELVGLSWELFEDGRLPEQTAISRIQAVSDTHGLNWANWLIKDDPDTFFDTLSLSKKLIPQTWVIFPKSFSQRWEHHGVLQEDDLSRIVEAIQSA